MVGASMQVSGAGRGVVFRRPFALLLPAPPSCGRCQSRVPVPVPCPSSTSTTPAPSRSSRRRSGISSIRRGGGGAAMAFHGASGPSAADESTATTTTTSTDAAAAVETALAYHERTKHHLHRYARGPGGLDWRNQPNPFRRYPGAEVVPLDRLPPSDAAAAGTGDPPYAAAFDGTVRTQPLSRRTLSQVLYDALAVSAWKKSGASVWSVRVNPSSGNLHPTEGYVVSGPVTGVSDEPFVAHYAPREHALEVRARLPRAVWADMVALGSRRRRKGSEVVFVALTTVWWREAWKYGERAWRYGNHDVGHAVGAVAVAAAGVGWRARVLDEWGVEELGKLLGVGVGGDGGKEVEQSDGVRRGRVPEVEREHPDCLMLLEPNMVGEQEEKEVQEKVDERAVAAAVAAGMRGVEFKGTPNALSREHVQWGVIYKVAAATEKKLLTGAAENGGGGQVGDDTSSSSDNVADSEAADGAASAAPAAAAESVYEALSLREVIHKRRSAVSMDPRYGMPRDVFFHILHKTLPLSTSPTLPFSALPFPPALHLVLFVHRVVPLPAGIYILVRIPSHLPALRRALRPEFTWRKPDGCPPGLPLYALAQGDCSALATRVSCHQDIAAHGCFSLGMLARFEPTLRARGAPAYPRLFWEAGLLGQLLYLEAHAVGVSATGIGCYFDDDVHHVLGLEEGSKEFQSLYHFTVGVPVLDSRILSLPPYPGPPGAQDE